MRCPLRSSPPAKAKGLGRAAPWRALAEVAPWPSGAPPSAPSDAGVHPLEQSATGAVYTPPLLAAWLAWRLAVWSKPTTDVADGEAASRAPVTWVDPAAGAGRLLWAAGERLGWPAGLRLVGADIEPLALRAASARVGAQGQPVWVCGDALAGCLDPWRGQADAVILNPPYIGEKGRSAQFQRLFQGLRDADPQRWGPRLCPRVDLQYLFMHLALDLLKPGGVFGALTAAYWPTATGAEALRADLAGRAQLLEIVDLGPWLPFSGRSLHALMCWGRRLPATAGEMGERGASVGGAARVWRLRQSSSGALAALIRDVSAADTPQGAAGSAAGSAPGSLGQRPWTPWSPPQPEVASPWHWHSDDEAALLEALDTLGAPLADSLMDHQGVVSGADRCVETGEGVFVLRSEEAQRLRERGVPDGWLWPLLRGAGFGPFHVHAPLAASAQTDHARLWLLYLCGDESDGEGLAAAQAHLGARVTVRAVLEARREVLSGRRPWWALQWPRQRALMSAPKLVCPRRARRALFSLDLGAHAVSSDCTWLTPTADVANDAAALRALHLWMNSSVIDFQLQTRGKRKGNLIELYAQPLRAVRLPRWRADPSVRRCVEALLSAQPAGGYSDPRAVDAALVEALPLPSREKAVLWGAHRARWSLHP
jgi:adenine-specific DNA-methyltransferase